MCQGRCSISSVSNAGTSWPAARTGNTTFDCPANWYSLQVPESRPDLTVQHSFALSWIAKVLGEKMYNHLIRLYHNAYAQQSS